MRGRGPTAAIRDSLTQPPKLAVGRKPGAINTLPHGRAALTRWSARCPIWLAYVRLEDPPGLSPITTVGRFATVEEARVATGEEWASR